MSETAYIMLPADGTQPALWAYPDAQGHLLSGRGGLADAGTRLSGQPVTVLVPAEDVLLTRVELPLRNRQRLLQAVPYALEEELVDPVEDLHFAPGTIGGAGADCTPVAVARHDRMQQWTRDVDAAGLYAPVLIPDVLALPRPDNGWTLFMAPERVLLRTAAHEGLALDPRNLMLMLQGMLATSSAATEDAAQAVTDDQQREVVIYAAGREPDKDLLKLLRDHFAEPVIIHVDGLLETLHAGAEGTPRPDTRAPLNLRQGVYTCRSERQRLWHTWRPVAGLAAAVMIMQFSLNVWEFQRLGAQQRAVQEEAERVFREAFPDIGRVVNMPVQARQEMAALRQQAGGSEQGFLWLLTHLARAMEPGSGVELTAISYQGGRLELQLRGPSLAAIEAIQRGVPEQMISAEIQSVSSQQDGVDVRLSMRGRST